MIKDLDVVIFAAGNSKRIKSELPKVLMQIQGKPLLFYILEKYKKLNPRKIHIIINNKLIFLKYLFPQINFILQKKIIGNAHAFKIFLRRTKIHNKKIIIQNWDTPFIPESEILKVYNNLNLNDIAILGVKKKIYKKEGVIIHNKMKAEKIIEHKTFNKKEKVLKVYNSGLIGLKKNVLKLAHKIRKDNKSNEYNITDIIEIASKINKKVKLVLADKKIEVLGINTPQELLRARKILK